MSNAIIAVYVALIRAGRRTLESVPETIRDDVAAALAASETAPDQPA